MIGNDVVDLELAKIQSNWRRKGYLNKIFTSKEQQFISESKNQDQMVWILWSRKEAAYKTILQNGGKRGYYPLKIENLDFKNSSGKIQFENNIYFYKTLINNDLIHSIVSDKLIKNNDFLELKNHEIIKMNDFPFVKINLKIIPVSKSHHGRFEKVVCLNSNFCF